jgi:NADH-quinone oxidoreductase subunit G
VVVTPVPDALDELAVRSLRLAPPSIASFGLAVAGRISGNGMETCSDEVKTDSAMADLVAEAAALLAAAEHPLVVAWAESGATQAVAALAQALGPKARIALVPPEANSLGLALLGARRGIESAASEQGVIVLEADLFERAPRAAVDLLLEAASEVLALDSLVTMTTARADIVLPVAAFTEAAGTFVNCEGRAQRLHAAVASGAPAAWRVLAALGAGDWPDLDALLADLDAELPGVATVAPMANFEAAHGQVTRTPRPRAGLTADDRAGRLAEAIAPVDPDSPLSWGLEGTRGDAVPPTMLTAYTVPGLHSANAVTRFQEEINGPLRGGDPGALLIVPGQHGVAPSTVWHLPSAPIPESTGDGLWLVGLDDAFTGTETSRASPLLAARAPAPRLLLHPADAARLGLVPGDRVTLDGERIDAPLTHEPGLARGVVAASLGTLVPRVPPRRVIVARAS